MLCTTVRQILANTEKKYGPEDAIRYKISKNEIEAKSYTQLKEDSESFSNVLKNLGEQGSHISVIGATSYPWLVTYFGTVNSGSVIVPLDVNLPAEDVCDLIDRSDSTILVYDEVRKDVAAIAKERCPKLKTLISMQQAEHDDHASSWRKLLEENQGSFDYEPEPDQLCTIMFTSRNHGKEQGRYAHSQKCGGERDLPGYEDPGADGDPVRAADPSRILPEHGCPERHFLGL